VPSIQENRAVWSGSYDWTNRGDEWSIGWGDAATEWSATLLPRLTPFLPAHAILEIAPGLGRWTQYLIPLCDDYIGVDLSESAVKGCKERFSSATSAQFFVNDGTSLAMVRDQSVDLAFSFDSLVHVEMSVLNSYFAQLAHKLRQSGVAFIHHSNLGAIKVPRNPQWAEWRDRSVSAATVAAAAAESGLRCIGQELITWSSGYMIDCISVLVRADSPLAGPLRRAVNPYFVMEAASATRIAYVYGAADLPAGSATGSGITYPVSGRSRRVNRASAVRLGPFGFYAFGPWWKLGKRPR
jgi:hypothetical protein